MTASAPPSRPAPTSLAPVGMLGFRGRQATPEERARILDAHFFEGGRRIPYLATVRITIVGPELPPDAADLASLAAQRPGREVDVEMAYVPMTIANAPSP